MACRYCGLSTDGGANHGCSRECVEALTAEAERLARKLDTTIRLPKPAVGDDAPDVQPEAASLPGEHPS
jgi:hypothetical protein